MNERREGDDDVEATAAIRVLQALARVEGDLAGADTYRAIRVVATAVGASASEAPTAIEVDAELALLRSPEVRRRTVRAAFAIAALGESTADGEQLLEQVQSALDPSDGGLAREEAARVRDVRATLDAATRHFLRAVARASNGEELSSASYVTLVQKLDARKTAALRGALLSEPPPHR